MTRPRAGRGRVFGTRAALAAAWLFALLHAAPARAADAEVERASALLASGDAAGALRVVAHIEARTDLPAGELISLLVLRARVHLALADSAALSADARTLVAVAPSWQASMDLPEALRAAVDEARLASPEAPSLDVDVYPAPGAARIVIEVDGESACVRGTRAAWRLAGEPGWHRTAEAEIVVRGQAGAGVEYFVEALGPGGVVVARKGSEARPERASVPGSEGDATGGLGTMTMADEGSSKLTWAIAGGVLVAAIVVVVVLVLVGSSEHRTDLGVPVLEWP